MVVKLLTEHHLEFLSLKGACRGSSESTHVKMSHCWKSHALAQLYYPCLETQVLHTISEQSMTKHRLRTVIGQCFWS